MSGWKAAVLSDVLVEARPGFACGDDVEDGVFQFRMNNVTTSGQIDLTKKRRVPRDIRNIDAFLVEQGDVLFNATNSPDLVGKTAYFPGLDEPAVFSNHFLRLRPHAPCIDGRFLSRWLNLQFEHGKFKGMCRQWVNQATVSRDALLALRLPLPPLPEQRRIAEILDKADALRAKRHDALARLDTLTQSIFVDMFGDPVRNDKNWPLATVASLCALVRGSSPRPQGDPMFFGGPVPRLMVADITRDGWSVTPRIDSLTIEGAKRSRPVPAGTIVMAVSGNVGLVSQLAVDACVHDGFVAFMNLDVNRCQPGFLLALLHYSKAAHERHKAGAIFINLTTTDIKAMRLPLPPIALQREFYGRMMSFDTLKTAQLAAQTKLEMLFASLQLRAFSGDLVSAGPGQLTV